MVEGGRPCNASRSRIHAARQTGRRISIGKWIGTVDQDAGRAAEPERVCLLGRLHPLAVDDDPWDLLRDLAQVLVSASPVRAVIEEQQRHFHAVTVNLLPQTKVKDYRDRMRIGEVSERSGLPTRTIRFYERRGLLPEPERSSNGYRVYDRATVARIGFIRNAQSAGFTLAEISDVIAIRNDGQAPCARVNEVVDRKLTEVQRRIEQLHQLRDDLRALAERGRILDPADCAETDICQILEPRLT